MSVTRSGSIVGRFVAFAAIAVASISASGDAVAGDCRPCTTDVECGANGVCVEWIGSPVCSGAPRSCCPGQACALNGGVPSCVGTGRCRLPTGGGADAGGPDSSGVDAAGGDSAGGDSAGGVDVVDSGTATDGSAGNDGGGSMMPGGCRCRAASPTHRGRTARAIALAACVAAGLLFSARRRRS